MTGATPGDVAADELEDLGVAEAAAEDWFCTGSLLVPVAGFLQADNPSAKRSGKNANRMSINEVKAFSLTLGKNKRFLVLGRGRLLPEPRQRRGAGKICGTMKAFSY
jgi:hypothetical protein